MIGNLAERSSGANLALRPQRRSARSPAFCIALGALLSAVWGTLFLSSFSSAGNCGFVASSVSKPEEHASGAAALGWPKPLGDGPSLGRRQGALLSALVLAVPPVPAALAEGTEGTVPAAPPAPAAAAVGTLQKVLINVVDAETLDKELKFWAESSGMKVLSDMPGADGNRTATIGFPSAGGASPFVLEFKVDPSFKKKRKPREINFNVMQPTINRFNFVQVAVPGKVKEVFIKVQEAGGYSVYGDASYLDVESPRGLNVRFICRGDGKPSTESLSLNVPVSAFEPTVNLYQRVLGMQEIEYDEGDPPIQQLSRYLRGASGGPNLLLCPVPDGRMKEKDLDEFDGIAVQSPSTAEVAKAFSAAVDAGIQEEKQKIERLRQKGPPGQNPELDIFLKSTRSRPEIETVGGTLRINDGIDNILFVSDQKLA